MPFISESTFVAYSQEFTSLKRALDRQYWSCKHFELITVSHHRNCPVIEDSLSAKPSSQQLFLRLPENTSLYFKTFLKTRERWKLKWLLGFPEFCECCVDTEQDQKPRYICFNLKCWLISMTMVLKAFSWRWMFEVTRSIVRLLIHRLNEHFLFFFFLAIYVLHQRWVRLPPLIYRETNLTQTDG